VRVEKHAILCQQTSPKRWFVNMNMTSNRDVTNSAHQIQMTTICHWMNPPRKNFCVRHWCQQLRVIERFCVEGSKKRSDRGAL